MDQESKRAHIGDGATSDLQRQQIELQNINKQIMFAMLGHFLQAISKEQLASQVLSNIPKDNRSKYFESDGRLKQPLIDCDFISPIFFNCNYPLKEFVKKINDVFLDIPKPNGVFNLLNSCKCSTQDMKEIFSGRYENFLRLADKIKGQIFINSRGVEYLKSQSNDFCDAFWGAVASDIKSISDAEVGTNAIADVFKKHFGGLLSSKAASSADSSAASTPTKMSKEEYSAMLQRQIFEQSQRRRSNGAVASASSSAVPAAVVANVGAGAAAKDPLQKDGFGRGFGSVG